jgi:hypothetical protein
LHSRARRLTHLGEASIVAGKELADLTLILPGPVAAEAFLDKMIDTVARELQQEHTSVAEAIGSGVLKDWTAAHLQSIGLSAVDDLCPMLFSLQQAAISTSGSEWIPSFERSARIKADKSLLPAVVATQVYCECLLVKAMKLGAA